MLALFLLPLSFLLTHHSIPTDVGTATIGISFLLGCVALADWYHLHVTNSFKGIALCLALGVVITAVSLAIGALASGHSPIALATFDVDAPWPESRLLMRACVVGAGLVAVAVLAVPRLALIRALSKEPLPKPA